MASEIRTGSLGGNPSTEKTAKNLDIAASEITTLQANATLKGNDLTPSTVAAAGSTQANAAQLVLGFNLVTAADGTKGVLLPAAAAGCEVRIKNNTNAVLKVWPATGDAINAIGAGSSMSIAAFTCPTFTAYDATTWYTNPLLPS